VERRPKSIGRVAGFVVAISETLMLFHQLDGDSFSLNGYCVIPIADANEYRVFDRKQFWQHRAAQLKGLRPILPDSASVSDWRELLESVAKTFPLVVVHTERKRPDVCYIGEVLKVSDSTLTIHDLNCNCEWQKPRRFKLSDITMVEFGDGYSMALAATAPKRKNL
jgi:hypothetical protein